MAGFINAIGVISGALGIIQFGIDNFQPTQDNGSNLKIAVGLDRSGGLNNAGGSMPDARIWNLYGDFCGANYDPGNVGDGTVNGFYVEHNQNNGQGVYTLFSANDDAICVAWATTTWSSNYGGNEYGVVGEFGYECGASWYYSGMYPYSDSDYRPKCFWIDKNGDQPSTGFQVRWPSYSGSEFDGNSDLGKFCNGIDFGIRDEHDPSGINYWIVGNKERQLAVEERKKRAAPPRDPAFDSQLVISTDAQHSATELCKHPRSSGPDFVNPEEGVFCDMGNKTVLPVCRDGAAEDCFNMDTLAVNGGPSNRFKRSSTPYTFVRDWRDGPDGQIMTFHV